MERIRILHCLETVGSGGVEQTRLSLARLLDPERYEQRLVCTQAIGGLPSQFEEVGCRIHEVGVFDGLFDRRPYKRALDVIREFKPHVIHGAVYEGVALAAVGGRLGRVPVIIGEETSDPANRSWKGSLLFRAISTLTHNMVAVSPAVKDYLVSVIRIPKRKVALINNGVVEKPTASGEEFEELLFKLDISRDDVVIGSVGRLLDEYKRTSDLIRSMPRILEKCPKAKLLIVGTGPDEQALKILTAELGIVDHVRFAGYQADTQPYYAAMDLFALASAHEAFGLVFVEAMFSNLPVVATRVGGIPSVVEQGRTGLLVDPCQPEQIADAILRIIQNPDMAKAMGDSGKARAKSVFSAERYVADVDRLYQRSLAERGLI